MVVYAKNSLINSEVTKDLEKLKSITYNIPWTIVSGGDQKELRDVFKNKTLLNILMVDFLGVLIKKLILFKEKKGMD